MKKLTLSISILMLILSISTNVDATHIVGGDMTYKCLGGDQYEITVTMRRDCELGSPEAEFDDPAVIAIFRTSDQWFMKGLGDLGSGVLEIPLSFNDTLNETTISDCGFVGNQVCVETTTYRKVVTLPFLEGGYTLVYQRCCRNQTISNIVDPLSSGTAHFVEISADNQLECNSSPTFNKWASVYICKDEPFEFDQSASDLDNDSLVYSLCSPHVALSPEKPIINSVHDILLSKPPYDQVVWLAPYTLGDVMGGTPLSIDSQTGLLTATPNLVGQFLVGICVDEYRDGVLIGRTRRDFEYNVRVCSDAPDIDFSFSIEDCGSLEVTFTNLSVGADSYEWNFNVPIGPTSIDTNPTFNYDDGIIYTVSLKGTRASDKCTIETIKEIDLSGVSLVGKFDAFISECGPDGNTLKLFDQSISVASYDRGWIVDQGGDSYTSDQEIWTVDLQNEEDVTVQLIVGNGPCADTLVKNYNYEDLIPGISVEFEVLECIDDSLKVSITAVYSTPDTSVHLTGNTWEIITGASGVYNLIDTSSFIFTILNNDSVDVTIHVDADNGCDIDYNNLFNPDEVLIELLIEDLYVLCGEDSIRIIANPNPNWTYTWEPLDGLVFESTTDFSNPWAKPTVTTTYHVTVTDGLCTENASVTIIPMDNLDVSIEGDRILCEGEEVLLWVVGDVVGTLEFEWSDVFDFGNILHTGDTLSSDLGNDISKTYYVRIVGEEGCMNGMASATVTRSIITLDIIEPNLICVGDSFVLDVIQTGLNLTYAWEDSPYIFSGADTKNPTLVIIEGASDFELIFTVTNEDGCTLTDTVGFEIQSQDPMSFTHKIECGSYEICFTSTSSVDDSLSYWDFGDISTSDDNAFGNEVCYTYPAPGEYIVTLTDLTVICSKTTIEQTVVVPELLEIQVEQDQFEICEGESIIINTTGNGQISYCDENGLEIGTGSPFEFTPSETMVITAKVKDEYGCEVSHDITVLVNIFESNLSLEVVPEHRGFAGEKVDLVVEGGLPNYIYLWDPTGESTSTISVDPLETTTYTVTVTDENGCFEILSVTLTIDEPVKCNEEDIFLPTAFSPNGNGENDVFIVRSNVLESMELVIYDRWGEEIFVSKDLNIGWDGTFNGETLSSDVYAFYLRAVCIGKENDPPYIKIGNVTLLK